jgi:acyl-CoA thioester hydrolase
MDLSQPLALYTDTVRPFSAEAHVTYQRELHQGDPLRFTTQLISFDTKRVHYFHRMFHAEEGYQAATFETLSLCMDMAVRRVGLWPDPILGRLEELGAAQAHLDSPPELGHAIGTPLS